jgi:predicted Zn-dependent protease with MMP-like domain
LPSWPCLDPSSLALLFVDRQVRIILPRNPVPFTLPLPPVRAYLPAMTNPSPDSIAPTLALIEQLAHETVSTLPPQFRALATHVRLRVEDFAEDEMLQELGVDDAFDLTGLYDGIPADREIGADQVDPPDVVWLFRRPSWTNGPNAASSACRNWSAMW